MSTPDLETKAHDLASLSGPDQPVQQQPTEKLKSKGRRDPVILIIVAMVISIMLVFGIQKAHRTPVAVAGKLQGKPAPDFTLLTPDGNKLTLSSLRGKAVLLNFWATWCEPCKVEMPWFVELQKKYGPEGLQILGVAMDDAGPDEISSFARKMGVNYPVLIGKEEVGTQYGGLDYLPSTFYIGRDGKVIDHVFGLVSRSEIEADIQKALAQQVATK